jgi:altronate dehydratase
MRRDWRWGHWPSGSVGPCRYGGGRSVTIWETNPTRSAFLRDTCGLRALQAWNTAVPPVMDAVDIVATQELDSGLTAPGNVIVDIELGEDAGRLDIRQMRRKRYHHRLGTLPDCGQHVSRKTDDLSDNQPTKDTIEGGQTTIEEKALGKLEKIGRSSEYIDILEPAAAPGAGNGLYGMDPSSAAAECVT